ncbi:hypothetical protein B0T19DRAFT_486415 [Cercophora scortea]|uniref:Transcription initiation factor IIF subunit alpha n=1 Tax=Cercophora scortea TaxID=314031 RepID=A0AAE0MA54_9PEZI|nr:hypothetical protein B0T19DRAFT_486415 [Cercophora scortea]
MSAPLPPPGMANGPRRPPPGAALLRRRKPNTDPLVARKKPLPKPMFSRPPPTDPSLPMASRGASFGGHDDPDDKPIDPLTRKKLDALAAKRQQFGGWSEPAPYACSEFPLVTTKRELLEGIRHHIMRLSKGAKGDATWDVTNQDQFPRPVTLLRRDPRLPPSHKMVIKEDHGFSNPVDETEADRLRQQKAEKEAQRALDQAQIAPVAKGSEPKPKQSTKKEKASGFYSRNSDEQKKQSGLRYEETLPWHLEDAENKSGVWVGSYIAGLSELNCALVIDGGNFRMIPLERMYKFDEKPKFDTLSLDDAENMMKQNKDVKRWVMLDRERQVAEKEKDDTRQFLRGPARVKTESATSRSAPKTERQDDYELDFENNDFQDDDETPGFEADDEDAKDAKERIRREQAAANLWGEGEEEKVDEEEKEQQIEKLKRKTMGKQTVKGLVKLEHAMDYDDSDSDAENNPFTDSSDSESESEEKKEEAKKEEAKKEEAKKDEEPKKQLDPKDQAANGKQKAVDASKKGKLKRPGSPNLSEPSDNESTRKKVKMTNAVTSGVPSRSGTPLPGRPKVGGATSDGEATAGEASDGGAKLKKKIKVKPGTGLARSGSTPSVSRQGSPNPPANGGTSTPGASPPPSSRIELSDIIQAIPQEGISIGDLLRKFHGRIDRPDTITRSQWIAMVREVAELGADKIMRLKPGL